MARQKARFRISIRDNLTSRALKIELVPRPLTSRYWVKQNGIRARNIKEANLSTVFARLRRWLVAELQRSRRQPTA
jgi:hypothetical protein